MRCVAGGQADRESSLSRVASIRKRDPRATVDAFSLLRLDG
jgi:hypothetical protein